MTEKPRQPISTKMRYEVFERDGFTCQYCGSKAPDVILHLDHKKPHSKGGPCTTENLTTACSSCNQGKGDSMPKAKEEKAIVETKHPLVGWTFLSYIHENGKPVVEWQGNIKSVFSTNSVVGDAAIVDFFGWMDGGYTNSGVIPLSDFALPVGSKKFFKLFATVAERNEFYNEWAQRQKAWRDSERCPPAATKENCDDFG